MATNYKTSDDIDLESLFRKPSTSVTAGTYGPTADVTITGGTAGSFNVPQFTVDAYGIITSISNRTMTFTDTNANCKATNTCNQCITTNCNTCNQCVTTNCNTCNQCNTTNCNTCSQVYASNVCSQCQSCTQCYTGTGNCDCTQSSGSSGYGPSTDCSGGGNAEVGTDCGDD